MKDNLTREQYTKLLLDDYFKKLNHIPAEQAECFHKIADLYSRDNTFLLQFYLAVRNELSELSNEKDNFIYKKQNQKCAIIFREDELLIERKILLDILGFMIELTEDVLPLGTMVELKKEYFKNVCDVTKIEKLQVVITNRFLKQDEDSYFTYGGVVYPVGNFNGMEILKFTPALIERVVQKGFQDNQDHVYLYLMKKELILEKGIKSVALRENLN